MTNPFISINLLGEALKARGFQESKVRLEGVGYRCYDRGPQLWMTPYGYVKYPFVSYTLRTLAVYKDITYDYVASQGYSIPKTTLVRVGHPYEGSTEKMLIVKPVQGSGSAGVTRTITDREQLQGATDRLHELGQDALIQEQFSGEEIRLTVLDGQVVSTCVRAVPQLVGNGSDSLADLLVAENEDRAKIDLPYIEYPQLTPELVPLPADMSLVPAAGQVVVLGGSSLISGGASYDAIDDAVHESYKTIARDIAGGLKAPFLVIDLLVHDYTVPAQPDNYVFLEFNTSPSLRVYYSFRHGKQFDIIPKLVDMIEAAI